MLGMGWRRAIGVAAAASALLVLAGCATMDRNIAMTEEQVTPLTAGDKAVVSATDLARAMIQAGFSHEEILKRGPGVRKALATSGGAQVRDGDAVLALFSIHGELMYVSSRTRGTFTVVLTS